MKKFIVYSVAALALASCSNEVLIDDIKNNDSQEIGIGFSTFTELSTKAENSGATATHGLESYQTSFKVWGSKYIQDETPVVVFEGQDVIYSSDWSYSPLRFWDKSAEKYDFYAAAPAKPTTAGWVWDNDTKKFSLVDFEVDGKTIDPSASVDAKAVMPNNKDIMISDDVTSYSTYTSDAVNLVFNHILSRFNIGIKKDATVLTDYDVELQSIEVFNMIKQASFNEADVADAATLKAGTTSRWTPDSDDPVKFTEGFGYNIVTEVSTAYNYVYQGLVIPQSAHVETVALDGKAHAAVPAVNYADVTEYNEAKGTSLDNDEFDGLSEAEKIKIPAVAAIDAVSANSEPYIVISYKIYTKEVPAVNYSNAAEYNSANNSSLSEAEFDVLPAADKIKTQAIPAEEIGSYVYHYNLANLFNGDTSNGVAFNEGWQEALNIIIKPAAIEFCPLVYEWDSTTPVEIEIPDGNGL